MTKRIPLDRLREISRQRAIRRPHVLQRQGSQADAADEAEPRIIEWPVRR
jgi:hypothetical protein